MQALCEALRGDGQALVVAADARRAKPASVQELQYGHGSAALMLGREGAIAEVVAEYRLTRDFVDQFRGSGEDFDYRWEERWIRDRGLREIIPGAGSGRSEEGWSGAGATGPPGPAGRAAANDRRNGQGAGPAAGSGAGRASGRRRRHRRAAPAAAHGGCAGGIAAWRPGAGDRLCPGRDRPAAEGHRETCPDGSSATRCAWRCRRRGRRAPIPST